VAGTARSRASSGARAGGARLRGRHVAAAAALALFALGAAATLRSPAPAPAPAVVAPEPSAPPAPAFRARVRILGSAELRVLARRSLERLLATRMGEQVRERLASGALREPLTIEVNRDGDQFTRYRVPGEELGETIRFDPQRLPLVETEAGPVAATPETVLAHELGHAVFKLESEEAVIALVENPVRDELGLPRRVRF
jgi:hypothetical protein